MYDLYIDYTSIVDQLYPHSRQYSTSPSGLPESMKLTAACEAFDDLLQLRCDKKVLESRLNESLNPQNTQESLGLSLLECFDMLPEIENL